MKKIFLVISLAFVLTGCAEKELLKITVTNPAGIDRKAETVELPVSDITAKTGEINLSEIIVTDAKGSEIPSQLIYEGQKNPLLLIFQVEVAADSESEYYLKKGVPQKYETRAYGRFVPERMDDYAWENDRIAFRIYGTALIAKDGPSNGLDVWVKRTDKMVIDRWYSDYLAGINTYHDDNGEGCDCYKVGRTLGAGAMAPFVNDSLWLGINFKSYETLDNGPVRISFRLSYPPFLVDTSMVTETRTISLDAGNQLARITEEYTGMEIPFTVAAGIVKRAEGKTIVLTDEDKAIAYNLDGGEGGITYLGTVLTTPDSGTRDTRDHLLLLTTYTPGQPLVYYTGAGWSKWGFETEESWIKYMSHYSLRVHNPLKVKID